MKKLLIILSISALLASCEKHDKETECSIVSAESVPKAVLSSFNESHSNTVVISWFNKDNTGYVAYYKNTTGNSVLTRYDNTGKFISEDVKGQKNKCGTKQHEDDDDDDDDDEGCECEIDD